MKSPMLNLEVLKFPTFTLTTIINMVVMLSLYGGMILLPIYLQIQDLQHSVPGLLLLPGSLIMGLLGHLQVNCTYYWFKTISYLWYCCNDLCNMGIN